MNLDDETLMAYADGELSPLETKRVERAMAEDAQLARRVARFVNTRQALKKAYDTVLEQPVPDHLLKLLDAIPDQPLAPPPTQLADERKKRASARVGPPVWAAIAASLVVGVLAGRLSAPTSGLFTADGAHAGASLGRMLDTALASETQSSVGRVGLTFRAQDGAICRTFSAERVSGLACRDDDAWAVRLAVAARGGVGAYRQAEAP
ncbi:MAG: hypothetical protein K2X34_07810, partial [Hyphomonadaceae bacterium]|nr:hypothetical protein [Hyphomonadaceae bacterium]